MTCVPVCSGESNQEPGIPAGDIIIVLEEKEHPVFKRNGMDLVMEMEISLAEALTGFQKVVVHLDDRKLLINHPPGSVIADGDIKAIPEEGMPMYKQPFEKGYLLVKFHVVFPKDGFAGEAELKKLEAILGPKPKAPAVPAEAEHHDLLPYTGEDARRRQASSSAYEEDDQSRGGDHGPGVQCANQ